MASNGYRPQNPHRRRKSRLNVAGLVKMTAVMALIVAAIVLFIRLSQRPPSADTFCEGVYVNGVSLGGYTYEEGVAILQTGLDKRLHEDSYVLKYGENRWTFTPSEFNAKMDLTTQIQLAWNFGHTGTAREMREQAEYVKSNPVHYDSELEFDTVIFDDFLENIKDSIDVEPVDATVITEEDEFLTITPSRDGVSLSLEGLRQTLREAILSGTVAEIELRPDVKKPTYTTEDLQANTQLIASYRTSTKGSSALRTRNIARALRPFNGVTVMPEETVSFNYIVGKRTEANGFFESPEYDGTTVISGIGGGTCQASTTLYGALLKANIEVVLRSSHGMTVGYVKPSLDAAVSDNGKDLQFTNYLKYPIYIYTSVDSERAQVNIYGPPCEYDIKLESEVTDIVKPKGYKTRKDKDGTHVYYVDDPMVLKSEGKNGLKSVGYRVYYDKTTGAEVQRQELSRDTYYPSQPIYWVGTHTREAAAEVPY